MGYITLMTETFPWGDKMDFDERKIDEGVDRVLLIAKNRTGIFEQLKKAVLENNEKRIKVLAKKLCGIQTDDDEGN